MLILSRHEGERIIIGEDIVITVVALRDDKVRLGIEAPPETAVHRQETYETLRREAVAAAGPGGVASPVRPGRPGPRRNGGG